MKKATTWYWCTNQSSNLQKVTSKRTSTIAPYQGLNTRKDIIKEKGKGIVLCDYTTC